MLQPIIDSRQPSRRPHVYLESSAAATHRTISSIIRKIPPLAERCALFTLPPSKATEAIIAANDSALTPIVTRHRPCDPTDSINLFSMRLPVRVIPEKDRDGGMVRFKLTCSCPFAPAVEFVIFEISLKQVHHSLLGTDRTCEFEPRKDTPLLKFYIQDIPPPHSNKGAAVVITVRILASQLGEPGSIPNGVAPGFSHVGIVSDDAAGRRVFSGISCSPRPFIPALFLTHPHFTSIDSQDLDVKSRPISSLTHSCKQIWVVSCFTHTENIQLDERRKKRPTWGSHRKQSGRIDMPVSRIGPRKTSCD
ncbi:hypothetical protein PR048_024833 [Dryococelus australis]|uniref:Uncharacterized protein n=1 Tax=Dryococelus australis TaxID=614101 RepID=A0ABQ9GPN9_9NEOP|nr:hypothetical protein PR048_024833 [Dryococelus australis]